jgi:hypothetical protein
VLRADPSPDGTRIAGAAQRAIANCGPYKLSAAAYDQWKLLDVELRP